VHDECYDRRGAGLCVANVDERDIRDLSRTAPGKSRATVHNILTTSSGLFAWAVREKLAGTNPVRIAREKYGEELFPDSEPRQPRALTNDEIVAAMEHVGGNQEAGVEQLREVLR
jgi:site-specific recombinase XerD